MKMKYFTMALLLAGSLTFITSCSNNDEISTSQVTMGLNIKTDIESLNVKSGKYTFTNVSNGLETVVDYSTSTKKATSESALVTLQDGLYNVTFIGTGTIPATEEGTEEMELSLQGTQQNVSVTGGACDLTITVYVQNINKEGDFVIAEVFATGTINASTGAAYKADSYIRIYNNSSKVLYADGLVLVESNFTTGLKFDYTPNIMAEAITVQTVLRIPGNGTEHPIQPGGELLICDNATDHRAFNANSVDLSNADFEWYIVSSNPKFLDTDYPDVPNMDVVFCSSLTTWSLTIQGNRAVAIGRFPATVSMEDYIAGYRYKYQYVNSGYPMSQDKYYKFPNDWVIDAVNMSPKNKYVWNVTDASLDMGFSYYGLNSTEAENYGKSVIRKVAYETADGRKVLQDTNNSTIDFIPASSASLISK